MITILVILIGIGYCELMWSLFNNGKRSESYVKSSMKFFIGLNIVIAIFVHSYGNLIYAIVISLYYFVLIPNRLLK